MSLLRAALAWCIIAVTPALAQDRPAAGTIDFVDGDAIVESKDRQSRIATAQDRVYQGDTVTTFAAAELHLKMADGGYLSLRENTKITLTEYVANGDDGDRSLIDLAKGAFRSVTGWIGKYRRAAYKVRTPIVTIGVRGTDHEPTHFEPGDPRGEPGSYDKVNEGRTVMQSKRGTVEVPANRAAHFQADQHTAPRVLASVPSFFRPAKNEQRFAQRAQESVRTIGTQRAARREMIQKRGVEKRGLERRAVEKRAPDRTDFAKKRQERKQQFEKKQLDKKQFERKGFGQKGSEKKRFEKKRK